MRALPIVLNALLFGSSVGTCLAQEHRTISIPPYDPQIAIIHFMPVIDDTVSCDPKALDGLTLSERLAYMEAWARAEVLAVVAEELRGCAYPGMRAFGEEVALVGDISPTTVESLTVRNPDYWRARLEMSPNEHVIPLTRAALEVASGRVEGTLHLVGQITLTADLSPWTTNRAQCLTRLLARFAGLLERRIAEGFALHDSGRLAEALRHYDAVLAEYPYSAFAWHERLYTESARLAAVDSLVSAAEALSVEYRRQVFSRNPVFANLQYWGPPSDEIAIEHAMRRELQGVFQDVKAWPSDLEGFARTAMDLGAYGTAADFFLYYIQIHEPGRIRESRLLPEFLYCLERLGVTEIREAFAGDFTVRFREIEKASAGRRTGR